MSPDAQIEASKTAEDRYLDLLSLCLIGLALPKPHSIPTEGDRTPVPADMSNRLGGLDWPVEGFTMIGAKRLQNLRECVQDVLENDVPGDFIEAGAWRGGASIFMRALLKIHAVDDRVVFVADSFRGPPPPNPERFPADRGLHLDHVGFLRASVEEVSQNFHRFGLLDDQVRLVEGWFKRTLPRLKDHTWSLVKLDGDLYESTITSLENLYPGLSDGGYLIVDHYEAVEPCKRAVDDYRGTHGIEEEIRSIDGIGVYWQKSSSAGAG